MTDGDLLRDENIEQTDVFCALTNDDEANIMSSMLAKRLGREGHDADLETRLRGSGTGRRDRRCHFTPQQATTSEVLVHVRRGDVARVHSLRRGAAEAMEAVAHGDSRSSRVVGHTLDEIELPEGTTIGAIVRGEEVLIAHDHLVVQPDDHVIMFLSDKRRIQDVEALFQVGLQFF